MRILSGMRPTGRLHLGHLVGAINNWFRLQDDNECLFMVADYHTMTTSRPTPEEFRENILLMAAGWRALGIDFGKSTVFVQSEVPGHAELQLVLSMITPVPWLQRDPTLKTMQMDMGIKTLTHGLLGYPVLQAADILLYRADGVPVGEDQAPHVEITREIARAFNRAYGDLFPEPVTLLAETPRLMGTDGKKMSKSLGNCIFLDDPPDEIQKKAMLLTTDPMKIHKDDSGDPDICSVMAYHKALGDGEGADIADAACRTGRLGCVEHKRTLAHVASSLLEGYRDRLAGYISDTSETLDMLKAGSSRASEIASRTMDEVRDRAGYGL